MHYLRFAKNARTTKDNLKGMNSKRKDRPASKERESAKAKETKTNKVVEEKECNKLKTRWIDARLLSPQ